MYDAKTCAMVQGWIDRGEISTFKRWALAQPIAWFLRLPTREAAQAKLDKFLKQRERTGHFPGSVLYISKREDGWAVIEAKLTRKPEELDALKA